MARQQLWGVGKVKAGVIIGGAILVLAIGGLVAWWLLARPVDDQPSADDIPQASSLTEKQVALRDETASTMQTEGSEVAARQLDERLQAATDDTDKGYIYTLKSSLETSKPSPDFNQALAYAVQADNLYPTFETALNAGDLAYQLNQLDIALKYYKLYLERSVTAEGTQLDPAARPYYEARVKELEG